MAPCPSLAASRIRSTRAVDRVCQIARGRLGTAVAGVERVVRDAAARTTSGVGLGVVAMRWRTFK